MMRKMNSLLMLQLSLLLVVVCGTFQSVMAFPAMRTTSTTYRTSDNTTESPSPTISPFPTISPQPTPNNSSSSEVPTSSPGNSTVSPAPSLPPTLPPTTVAPTTPPPTTVAPTHPPTTVTPTQAPTLPPVTTAPTPAPTPQPTKKKQHPSLLRILGKTIAWLFIIFLALLGFGFLMSNRYRIYYYLRSAWYRFLQLPCTLWLLRKTGLNRILWPQDDLNEIIFDDNDLNEGLLLQDT